MTNLMCGKSHKSHHTIRWTSVLDRCRYIKLENTHKSFKTNIRLIRKEVCYETLYDWTILYATI